MSSATPPNSRGTLASAAGWTLRVLGQTLFLLGRATTAVGRVLTAAGRSTAAAGRALGDGSADSALEAGPHADEWSPTGPVAPATSRVPAADRSRSAPRGS